MKSPFSVVISVAITLLLMYQASHWFFKYADAVRFDLQQKLVPVDSQSHAIFEEVLGEHYVLIDKSKMSYGLSPFYYTYFQAIPAWLRLADSKSYSACAVGIEYCKQSVQLNLLSYAAELYHYILDIIEDNGATDYRLYCIANINAVGMTHGGERDEWPVSLSFYTEHASYQIFADTRAQFVQWQGVC